MARSGHARTLIGHSVRFACGTRRPPFTAVHGQRDLNSDLPACAGGPENVAYDPLEGITP